MLGFFPEAIPSLAAVFYNKVTAQAFRNFYRDVAREVTAKIQSGRILDIGTGPGYLPIEIAMLSSKLNIVGIDSSRKMVEIARVNAKKSGVRNVRFELVDANELFYGIGKYKILSYDFIFSTCVLHHWRNREKIFNNINGVLNKEAFCWLYDLRRDATNDEIRRTLRRPDGNIGYMRWAFKLHGFKTEEYYVKIKPLLENMNIDNLNIEKIDAVMRISWKKPRKSG